MRIWDVPQEAVVTTLESPQEVAAKAIKTGFPPENVLLVWDVITAELVNTLLIAARIRTIALHPTENKVSMAKKKPDPGGR